MYPGSISTVSRMQRGGALMVSMVLIFMMSLMGISAMRSANLDKRMSTNAVHKSRTLQAAESATELAYEDATALGDAFTQKQSVNVPINLHTDPELQSTAIMQFTGMGLVPGSSSNMMGPKFEVVGTARLNNVSATSIVVQGSYLQAPGSAN